MGSDRQHVIQTVRRYGASTSDAILDHTCKIFCKEGLEGLIGYRLENNCAIVYGDPICPSHELEPLTRAFHQRFKRVIYVAASEPFAQFAQQHFCKITIEFGKEIHLNPKEKPQLPFQEGISGCNV